MKTQLSTALVAGLLAVLTLGCSSNDGTTDPQMGAMAEIQVAHLSPDAPNVDVWLDGAVVLPNVPYQEISGYLPVAAGSHRVQVTPAGATTPVVIDATLDFAGGTATTVAATGLVGASDLLPIVLDDDRSAGSQVGVRFVHASPGAPAVDIVVAGGGPMLFSGVGFRESQGYATVPGGTYDLEVLVSGTTDLALSLPGVVLTNGTNVTVYAVGDFGVGDLGVLVAADAP